MILQHWLRPWTKFWVCFPHSRTLLSIYHGKNRNFMLSNKVSHLYFRVKLCAMRVFILSSNQTFLKTCYDTHNHLMIFCHWDLFKKVDCTLQYLRLQLSAKFTMLFAQLYCIVCTCCCCYDCSKFQINTMKRATPNWLLGPFIPNNVDFVSLSPFSCLHYKVTMILGIALTATQCVLVLKVHLTMESLIMSHSWTPTVLILREIRWVLLRYNSRNKTAENKEKPVCSSVTALKPCLASYV